MKTIRELDGAGIRYLWSKIKTLVSGSVSGKVDKVSSSTDNAIVRFDGTSGNMQNSGVTINDSNHLTAAKLITSGGTSSQFVKGDGTLDSASYAPLASPGLTGTPTAPTASSGTNTTQIATTAFVKSAIDTSIGNIETLLASI